MTDVEIRQGKVATAASPQVVRPEPAAAVGAAGVEAESFGRALANARQARGLSQGDVAAQLRLQLRQVRAIEAEDFSALPEGAFVRGFVRNYAKLVDVPAAPLLQLVNARLQPSEPLRGGAGTAAGPVRLAARERVSRLAVVGGAMALLLVFAVLGWWTMRPSGPEVAPPPQAGAPPPASSSPPAAAPVKAAPPPAAAPAVQAPTAEVAASAPAGAAVTPAPTRAAADAAGPPVPLAFSFRGRSWVQVTQGDGTVLMSRNHGPGERTAVEGTPPFALVIGNASKVDLEFRGKPIDLREFTGRGDIARLRLE